MAMQIESGGDESYELQTLRDKVQGLCKDFFNDQVDRPLADREDLGEIFKVLGQIEPRIVPDDGNKKEPNAEKMLLPLPPSKREELHHLLPLIGAAFQKRKQLEAADRPADKDLQASATSTGCYPRKARPRPAASSQQQSNQQQEGGEKEDVSLKLLLRLAQNVLEPEQYYEWTTSYVDEERIYGWQKEADEVAASLVAPDGGERMFRAAGIAGIHGSGKTALAQKVFVHDKAKDFFAIRLWVCVGPPDSEDRFNLLYRMLDNLGLDTAKVEDDIVPNAKVVKQATKAEEERIEREEPDAVKELREEAANKIAADRRAAAKDSGGQKQKQDQPAETVKKPDDVQDAPEKEEAGAGAGDQDAKKAKEEEPEEERIFKQLLKKKADKSAAVQKSKIGVLLYILHVTLSKTSYLIVFDDIRAYDGQDGWYSNLTLPPPAEGEWGDRLAYGLPKVPEHRSAVLVTCRREDDAKIMVRTGRVFHPPKLQVDDAWKLFRREYDQAKKDAANKKREKDDGGKGGDDGEAAGEDMLLKDLEQMKEEIVNKCLGLPVAIIEAAKGFAVLDPLPEEEAVAQEQDRGQFLRHGGW